MSAEERETLSLGLARGHSLRMMATVLGRAPSTVSRESAPNNTQGHPYRACTAQTQATVRARQPRRPRKLAAPWLWQYVQIHLPQGCSPETIYAGLYVLPRGTLRSERLAARRPRARGAADAARFPI